VFSAEGATSTSAWGVAPGIRLQQQQALKARFNQPPIIELVSKVNRAFSPESFRGCPRFATANPSCGGLAMRRALGAKHLPNTDVPAFEVEHALRDFKLA
jgi:hypothetical protein